MNIFRIGTPFMNFMSRLVDIVVLGIITVICCIPLVTVGAAFAALYYVCLKIARGQVESNLKVLLGMFFRSFGENFWKATALWAIMAAAGSILIIDFTLLTQLEMNYESAIWIVLIILTVLGAMIGSYLLPLQAQFENPVGRTVRNAFILSIMNLPRSILILLVKLSPLFVAFIYPEIMYILGIFCLAGIPYLESEMFMKIFDKYIPDDEDEDEEEEYDTTYVEDTATPVFSSGEDLLEPANDEE